MRKVALLLVMWTSIASADGKKRETAMAMSGVGAGVSSALILAGFMAAQDGKAFNTPLLYTGLATSLVTPSLGQWYAGEYFTPGMAVRIAAVGLATFAIAHEQDTVICDTSTSANKQMCTQFSGSGIATLGLAAIAYVGGVAVDVMDAGPAVDRYNRNHGIYVAPTPNGVAIAGYF